MSWSASENEMKRSRFVLVAAFGLGLWIAVPPLQAAVTVYTDRAAWEAAVTCPVTEAFEQDTLGTFPVPFVTGGGTRLTSVSGAALQIQVLGGGLFNGTRELHFRDFNAGVRLTFSVAARAFGFDYDTAFESWTLSAGGQTTNLPGDSRGFIGYVDDSGSLAELILTGATGAQGGISLDNLSAAGAVEVRRGGVMDDFAPPTEIAPRSSRLNAKLPPTSAWKRYDDPQIDRFFGHSFFGLPAGIVRAELVIRMRPGGGGASNDNLLIGIRSNGQVAFSRRIADLPGANGSWLSNPATTFVLDLSNLPGGGNLLPQIAADGFLDFYLQDDTTVDFSELRFWVCPPRKISSGLPNVGVRGGTLEVRPDPGVFTVFDGGLGIDTGQAEGVCVGFEEPVCLGVGTALELAASGQTPTEPWMAHLTFEENPATGLIDIKADFSPNPAPCTRVRVCQDDLPVEPSLLCIDNEKVLASIPPDSCIKEVDWIEFNDVDSGFSILFEPEVSAILPNGQTATGNRIKVFPDIPVGEGKRTLNGFQVLPSGIPSFTVGGELVQSLGFFQQALGNALLQPSEGALTLDQLGTSGEDGVAVKVGRAEGVDVDFAPIETLGPLPDGAFLQAEALGELNGVPGRPLGDLRVTKAGEEYTVTADFLDVSSPTQRVQVLRDGALIVDLPGHTGVAARASAWPRGLGKLFPVEQTQCYVGDWPDGTEFTIDGTTYIGDELRVLAESPTATVGAISDFHLRAAGLPELTLTNVDAATGCTPGPERLCLNGGRFQVEVEWETSGGSTGRGQAVPLTSDTGYFWFFDSANVEIVIKALNGCPVNDRYWIFAGGLTDVETRITVTDTQTGDVKTYLNPKGTAFQPLQDTSAFATCSAGVTAAAGNTAATDALRPGNLEAARSAVSRQLGETLRAAKAGTALLLNQNRFRVEVEWETSGGLSGQGQAELLTSDTGYFWFFDSANVEIVIKVLDGCGLNNRYWVFAGGLTDVRTRITVTDTSNGTSKTYLNPQGTAFLPIQDTSAFATCP
jgi:hypothetical protein